MLDGSCSAFGKTLGVVVKQRKPAQSRLQYDCSRNLDHDCTMEGSTILASQHLPRLDDYLRQVRNDLCSSWTALARFLGAGQVAALYMSPTADFLLSPVRAYLRFLYAALEATVIWPDRMSGRLVE